MERCGLLALKPAGLRVRLVVGGGKATVYHNESDITEHLPSVLVEELGQALNGDYQATGWLVIREGWLVTPSEQAWALRVLKERGGRIEVKVLIDKLKGEPVNHWEAYQRVKAAFSNGRNVSHLRFLRVDRCDAKAAITQWRSLGNVLYRDENGEWEFEQKLPDRK